MRRFHTANCKRLRARLVPAWFPVQRRQRRHIQLSVGIRDLPSSGASGSRMVSLLAPGRLLHACLDETHIPSSFRPRLIVVVSR